MRCLSAAAIGTLSLGSLPALAINSSEYLFVPTVTQGERELDVHMGAGSAAALTGAEDNFGVGFGMGLTAHWFSEIAVQYIKKQNAPAGLDALEWENTLQIGEPGQWPVDAGMVFNLEQPVQSSLDPNHRSRTSIRFGPLLQKDYGRVEANFNLLLVHHLQSPTVPTLQLRYQAQIKYRYSEPLEFGVQAFGRVGSSTQTWSGYDDQVHRIGPVVLGRIAMPRERSLTYNAGVLLGSTPSSPDRTLRIQLEYEF